MGAVGGIIAPLIAGVATAGVSALAMNSMMKNNQQDASQLMALTRQNNQSAMSTLPKAPEAPTGNASDASTNAAEAERQKQLAAMAASEAAVNPTGGLGLTDKAPTKKKTLGGM